MTPVKKMLVRVPEEQHKAARVKAVEQGKYLSEIVRELLALWLDGKIELSSPESSEGETRKNN